MSEQENKAEPQAAAPPAPSFFHIVQEFTVKALLCTGHLANPADEKAEPNLDLARYQIGLLELLEQKTKGNLTGEEKSHVDEMLHAVRMAFLHASNRAKKGEAESLKTEAPSAGDEVKQ